MIMVTIRVKLILKAFGHTAAILVRGGVAPTVNNNSATHTSMEVDHGKHGTIQISQVGRI
jgi:hypothetical protein